MSGDIIGDFKKGEKVRRVDTHRVATVIQTLKPWNIVRLQFVGGQEDLVPASLLECVPARRNHD